MRNVLASTHLLNFLIGLFAIGYVLSNFWNNLNIWQFFFYLYILVLCFSGVTIACWIMLDGNRIEQAALETRVLEQRISELEKQIQKIRKTELLMTRFKD